MNTTQQIKIDPTSYDGVAYASMFFENFSIFLSVIIGIIAMVLVLRSASKMGGGLFGIVLNYIGAGMFFIVLANILNIFSSWFGTFWIDLLNMTCLAFGYIFMVIGAKKLLKGIMNN